jgi:hypothetical protein
MNIESSIIFFCMTVLQSVYKHHKISDQERRLEMKEKETASAIVEEKVTTLKAVIRVLKEEFGEEWTNVLLKMVRITV